MKVPVRWIRAGSCEVGRCREVQGGVGEMCVCCVYVLRMHALWLTTEGKTKLKVKAREKD